MTTGADALLHAEVMAIAASEIACSTPARVISRHPLGRGRAGLLLLGGIRSSWEVRQMRSGRTVYLPANAGVPNSETCPGTRWTSTPGYEPEHISTP